MMNDKALTIRLDMRIDDKDRIRHDERRFNPRIGNQKPDIRRCVMYAHAVTDATAAGAGVATG